MAEARPARLIAAEAVGPQARLLRFALPEALAFRGGQYVIFNTGITLPDGRLCKRAYSIVSSDRDLEEIEFVVRRIGAGPGSNRLHQMEVGEEIEFSGPWGKFWPEAAADEQLVILATDTGITAALGLVHSRHLPLNRTRLIWAAQDGDFVSRAWIEARLPAELAEFQRLEAPATSAEGRANHLLPALLAAVGDGADWLFFSGDGAIVLPLRDHYLEAGVEPQRVRVETFFHHPTQRSRAARP